MDCWSSEKHNLPFTGDDEYVTKIQKFQTKFQIHDPPRYEYMNIIIFSFVSQNQLIFLPWDTISLVSAAENLKLPK